MTILVDLQEITLEGSDRTLLENLSLTITSGDRIGVVGINGVGKTTLLKIIAGAITPDSGTIRRGRDVRVGFLGQMPSLPTGTIRETLGTGWKVDAALDRLGMLGEVDVETKSLSGGQLKRIALARVFGEESDVLILDEPTNHLDLNAIQWLEQQIASFKGAVVLVSHDRFLLDQVTTRMVEIDRGKTFIHAGGYSRLLEVQAEREEKAISAEQVRRNLARTELAWLRRGVKARATKPQARIDAANRLLASRPQGAARVGALDLITEVPRLGTTVIKAHQVSFAYDGGDPILHDVSLDLGPGERLGVVGPNGAGKSTFINLLAQRLAPSKGTVKRGSTVVTSYLEQSDVGFDLEATVQELVAGPRGIPGSPDDVALMKRFWFTGALPMTKAKELSGGERRRLQLLLVLSLRPNVLFLDEPTNDLDLETIRLVEEFLSQWSGTLVVVSHDRTFLSRTTDRLIEVRTDGTIVEVSGGIDAWIERTTVSLAAATSVTQSAKTTSAPTGRQIRDAEKDMARLERRRSAISEKILSSTDHEEQSRLGSELAQLSEELNKAEERWLALVE
ncbi:MAG: transporter [Acidimicrobiaceae bacterium]|nr:transporter [Acidimicrobiaceae bacterium]